MSWMERKKKKLGLSKVNVLNTPFLVIVESPSKCAKIEKYLGFQYKCIASKGHLREIKKVTKKYEIEYQLLEDRVSHVEEMRRIIDCFKKENIIIATDDDREGEAIGWHICQLFELPIETTKRIVFHEITPAAINQAILQPTKLRLSIIFAQQARQVLDRLIGFKISPFLTQIVVSDHFLSAGRCQTPTIRLICDLDKKPKTEDFHYDIMGSFFKQPFLLHCKLNKIFLEKEKTEMIDFLSQSKTFVSVLYMDPSFTRKERPPEPFNTSTLLQAASNQLHLCPAKTMSLLQTLYQNGFITYMRTDSKRYSKIFIEETQKWISDKYGESFCVKESQIEDDKAHEAIRVTNLNVTEHIDNHLKALYHMVWKRTIQSCMEEYKGCIYPIRLSAPQECFYETEKEETLFLGWKIMNKNTLKSFNMDLHSLKQYDKKPFSYLKIECLWKSTERPFYYTEASLISKMEEMGIGRPSTYAMLVGTIKDRDYVRNVSNEGKKKKGMEYILENNRIEEKEVFLVYGEFKNKVKIQELGRKVVEVLYDHFPTLFEYEYTKQMEDELDKIVHSDTPHKGYQDVCESCEVMIDKCIERLKTKMKKEYKINESYNLIFGKKGPLLKSSSEAQFKNIRSDILLDFDKLETGAYALEDLEELPSNSMGVYDELPLFFKKGPFGFYVKWGENTKSLKNEMKDWTFDKITEFLNESKKQNEESLGVIRNLDENSTVKKGKYGPYIFYTKSNVSSCISLKSCPYDYLTCDKQILKEWFLNEFKKKTKKDI